jgi:hypothetical protein
MDIFTPAPDDAEVIDSILDFPVHAMDDGEDGDDSAAPSVHLYPGPIRKLLALVAPRVGR